MTSSFIRQIARINEGCGGEYGGWMSVLTYGWGWSNDGKTPPRAFLNKNNPYGDDTLFLPIPDDNVRLDQKFQ
jgi:hypothetical protein